MRSRWRAVLHGDEVDDDRPGEVAQADCARGRARGGEVGRHRGRAAAIDIDLDGGGGGLDRQRAAAGERDARRERGLDRGGDDLVLEERRRASCSSRRGAGG